MIHFNRLLQVYLPKDFLEQLEHQFSVLKYPEEIVLPTVFRWPERRLRICLLDAAPPPVVNQNPYSSGSAFHSKVPTPGSAPPHLSISAPTTPADYQPIKSGFPQVPSYTSPSGTLSGFPHFPPGCIPPPRVIAEFINSTASSGNNFGRKPYHGATSPGGSLSSAGRSPHGPLDSLPYQPFPYPSKPSPASAPGFHPSPFPIPFPNETAKQAHAPPPPTANTFSPVMLEAMQTMIASLSGLYRPENNNNKGGNPFGFPQNPAPFLPPPDQPSSRPW